MLSRTTARRTVIAAMLAAAVTMTGAATAGAAPVSDDTAADFAAGTLTDTVVRGDGAAAGVELARTLEETFDGPGLPAGWSSNPWDGQLGTSTITGGSLVVDAARADSGVSAGPGSSLEFRATLGAQSFTHVGFGDFNTRPWAMFSTGGDGGGNLYARVADGVGPDAEIAIPIATVDATLSHLYRIEWTATGFNFFVDGVSMGTLAVPLVTPMHPQVSNYLLDGGNVSVESMTLNTHKPSGTFVSRVFNAGDPRVTALTLTTTPAPSASMTIETRTAATSGDLATAPWVALPAGGAVAGAKQFVQYRASLSTAAPATTPVLDKVDAAFTIDDVNPAVAIQGVAVSGADATVTFTADGAANCALDGAPAADCTSPKTFTGLADGAHTVTVSTTDGSGNIGTATKAFTVDTVAPVLSIGGVAVSGTTATVTFSSDDAAATARCKLDGGAFAPCTSPAAFAGLAPGAHTIAVQATDAHGNTSATATRAFDVAAPAGGGGTTPPTGGGGTTHPPGGGNTPPADTSKPNVLVLGRSLTVSSSGVAKLRIRCPRSETSCAISVKVKKGGKRIARKSLTIPGGSTRTLRLQLSHAVRAKLAAKGKLTAKAVITATDAAGNAKTTTRRITLKAPAV